MESVQASDLRDWNAFYREEKCCPVFQSPQFAGYLGGVPGLEPLFLCVRDSVGHVTGVLLAVIQHESGIKGPFSARSVIYGGPVVSARKGIDRDGVLSSLLVGYEKRLPRGIIYTEIRNSEDRAMDLQVFESLGFHFEDHYSYLVDLDLDPEVVFSRIHPTKRRQIRKAMREGVTVDPEPSRADLEGLYDLLRDLYRTRVRKPLPAAPFVLDFGALSRDELNGKVFVVKSGVRVIGGIVCPVTRKETIYEWYVCGDRAHDPLHPSLVATWAPIEWGCRNGLATFDFMGAGRPDEEYGVREFKKNFGGRLVNYGRFRKAHRPALMVLGRVGLAVARGKWR
jgi:serine/alanine adding enzyme